MGQKEITVKTNKVCKHLTLRIPKMDSYVFCWDYKDLSHVSASWVLLFTIFCMRIKPRINDYNAMQKLLNIQTSLRKIAKNFVIYSHLYEP